MERSEIIYKLQNDDILYFLHIPKTAGTTFTSIIDEHFDYESIFPGQRWDQLLPNLPINFSKYRLVRGHFGYGIRQFLSKKPVYITMLRNPIERSISWYDFVCDNAEKNQFMKQNLFDKSFKLADVLAHPDKKITFENEQVRYLSKEPPTSFSNKQINEQNESIPFCVSLPQIASSDLEIAKQRLSEFPFFGLAERFEDSMFLLCYTFCWRPIRRVVRKMIGSHLHTIKDVSNDVINTLKEITKFDADLYEFAQEHFEIRFNKMVKELKKKYYEQKFEEMLFHQMIFEMLEKHYEENFETQIKNSIDYNFRERISGSGWHAREKGLDGVSFRWIGKESVEIDFPLLKKQQYKFQISICQIADPKSLQGIKFQFNNQLINMKLVKYGKIFEGIIPKSFLNHKKKFTRITIEISHTIPKIADGENVGIAPNRIKITPYLPK